ncbi:CHAD domain-containing protein [Kitasatospora sp. GP30]|uniref:CYTH and CHAD domain-containing protein n=1 Tax=Kitasatospora sp. GP30 TaxID=3035084 RepID=UPI000C70CD2E|nr:CYTH and CHAD domain-containing protein [Kitasatospora sp. GP30]MDH6143499.1 CHAD domain-containing protein [Kitasatospora sp. GP30]
MSTSHIEAERKFESAPGDVAAAPGSPPRLDGVPGVADIRNADSQTLDAVYYDTLDLRLLTHGVTLRRRLGGADAGWHLKRPQATDTRQEVRLPPEAGPPNRIPPELTARVRALVRGRTLAPVAHLRTHRDRRLLLDRSGRTLAELTQDRVIAHHLDPAAHPQPDPHQHGAGTATEGTEWTEFEVELHEGDRSLLDDVEQALAENGIVRSAYPSKLAHALLRTAPPDVPTDPTTPGDGIGELVVRRLRQLFETLLALDPAVRDDRPDAVHRMRVTTRRLRSTLKAYRRLFDRHRSEHLAGELRWLGHLLGAARDHEVLGDLLIARLDKVPPQAQHGALRGQLTAWSAREYRRAWQQAVTELDGPRYYALLDDLELFIDDPPLSARADRNARKQLSKTLRHEQTRTVRRLDTALGHPPGPDQDAALHSARKAAKRARYAAESARPLAGKPAKRFAKRMKRLQQGLGIHQDAVVGCRTLVALASSPPTDVPGHLFAYGVLYALHQHSAEVALEELPVLRSRVVARRLSRLS